MGCQALPLRQRLRLRLRPPAAARLAIAGCELTAWTALLPRDRLTMRWAFAGGGPGLADCPGGGRGRSVSGAYVLADGERCSDGGSGGGS